VPLERLLVETDAPDQPLPAELVRHTLPADGEGRPVNHPANLGVIYEQLAGWLHQSVKDMARHVEENFARLFEPVLRERK
jgi:Tat protein secretion system quality control protein TatD with DNase activity